jgi:hypothetical protein
MLGARARGAAGRCMHVLAGRCMHVLAGRCMHVLAGRCMHVLAGQCMHVLAGQCMHAGLLGRRWVPGAQARRLIHSLEASAM